MPEIPKKLGIFHREEWRIDDPGGESERQGLYLWHNDRHVGDLRQSLEYPGKLIVRFFIPKSMVARSPEYVDDLIMAAAVLYQYKAQLDEG